MPNTATPPDRTTAGRVNPGTAILWNFDDDKGSVPVTFVRRMYQDDDGVDLENKVRLVLHRFAGEEVVTQPVGKATRIQLDPGSWNQAAADALKVGPADELGPVVTNAAGERVGVPAPEVRAELAKAMDSIRPTAATVGKTPDEMKAAADAVVAIARATVPTPPSPAVEAALARAREKHRPDETTQPVTVEPLIERVRAERAATSAAIAQATTATAKAAVVEAGNVAPADLTLTRTYPLEGKALARWNLVAQFRRQVTEVLITNGEESQDIYLVQPSFPDGVGFDDYRTQLDAADILLDQDHPEWRTDGPWQFAGLTSHAVMFSRPVVHT